MEAQLIIAMLVQRFDLALIPDHAIKPEVVFVLRPDRQMKVTVSPAPA
jgi:cytochrome P450